MADTTAITQMIRSLHDDVEQSDSRPSAEEICARLLAIESLVVAKEIRRVTVAAGAAQPVVPGDAPFKPGEEIAATHPRAVDDEYVVDEDEAEDEAAEAVSDARATHKRKSTVHRATATSHHKKK